VALSTAADSAPGLIHATVGDVRESLLQVIDRLDEASASLVEALRVERVALSESVHTEREAVAGLVDKQRQAIALDATNFADRVVRTSGGQVRLLAREVMLWLILLAVIVLGLPFVAGYIIGRGERERMRSAHDA
jgi:hypothetical protein